MIVVIFLLIGLAASHKVIESTEDIEPNITTLYPTNRTVATSIKSEATSWKLDTAYAEDSAPKKSQFESTNGTDAKEVTLEKPVNNSKEFKPSQHLGSYIDLSNDDVVPTRETFDFTDVIKKPPTGFFSSFKEDFKPLRKVPIEVLKNYQEFPYKIESPILTRTKDDWTPTGGVEPKPTAEAPVRIPAGGLYKEPNAFKDKPGSEEFGLEFSGDFKESSIKKSPNPWKKILHFLTALIPIGIIISALTPSVITIENTGTNSQLPLDLFHRSDLAVSGLPTISERCRRRLLCELHSDKNYEQFRSTTRRVKKCHRLRCEDPEALDTTLRWLLAQQRPSYNQ